MFSGAWGVVCSPALLPQLRPSQGTPLTSPALCLCASPLQKLPIKHIPGPEGVRGRNSDNELILEKLG